MDKIGVIDLGTNTFNLLVAEISDNQEAKYIHKEKMSVKIGEGGITKNTLQKPAVERAIASLKKYGSDLKKHNVQTVYALATSAVRSADNKNDFILRAWNEAKVYVNVVSGDEEAELIFDGVRQVVGGSEHTQLIMDIGGGSTEFILCVGDHILWKKSFDLGAARLLERFKPSDPISQEELNRINRHLTTELLDLWEAANAHPPKELIGSSGSFDSYAEMITAGSPNDESLDGNFTSTIDLESYLQLHQKLIQSNREERVAMPGLIPMRVDMIVLASIMTHLVIDKLGLKQITQSAFALKEGVLERLKTQDHKWLKSSL